MNYDNELTVEFFYFRSIDDGRMIDLNYRNDLQAIQWYYKTFFDSDLLEPKSRHHVPLKRHQKFLNKGDPREFIG